MPNQQLLDYIKVQLSKGMDKESIIKDLTQSGLDDNNIQEEFNTLDIQTNTLGTASNKQESEFDKVVGQVKHKENKLKKILKIILFVWLGIEIINLSAYIAVATYRKNNMPEEMMYIPSSVKYRPVIIQIVYKFFPSLDTDSCKDCVYKPVIYLYPTQTENIKVELDYKGKLIADYPSYDYSQKGWSVTASPDGKIINYDGKEYSYLFWEGKPFVPTSYDMTTGFVIKGEDTVKFLQEVLPRIGLTPKEYNEFIVYWYPIMKDNKYNLIHFADTEYTDTAPLVVVPKPDSMLRVFMVFKPLNKIVDVKPQEIKPFARTGFSVIEWGGTVLNK